MQDATASVIEDISTPMRPRTAAGQWTLQTLLADMATRAEHPALIRFERGQAQRWSYAALAADSRRLADGLLRSGVKPGTAIALWAPNSPEWVIVRLAIGGIGALAVTIDDLAALDDASAILRDSGCRWLFTTGAHADAKELESDLATFVIDRRAEVTASAQDWRVLFADPAKPLPLVEASDPAMLVYTSGTTGTPKCFTLTSANIWSNLGRLREEHLIGASDRVLLPLPLHHIYPFVLGLLMPLVGGATVVFPEAVGGPEFVHALRDAQVTVIVGVPRLYAAVFSVLDVGVAAQGPWSHRAFKAALALVIWLRRRLGISIGRRLFRNLRSRFAPQLHLFVSGGARLDPDLAWKLEGLGWRVLSGYGLAETASMFTGNLPREQRIGTEGRPLQRGMIRIATPDSSGIGEIELKGPNVFAGYRNNATATQSAFTADGWFRTGDLGTLDRDGFLTVTGRATELIVLGGGKHFFPEDLERKYAASPFIEEIAVLEQAGSLVALVLPNHRAINAAGRPGIEDALRVALADISRELPAYQRLAGFAIARAPLPRTRLGKYRRFLLPDLYRQARAIVPPAQTEPISAEDADFLAIPPVSEMWKWLKERYPTGLTLDANPLLDLGVDSLERLSLALALEARFHVRLSEADLIEPQTIRELLKMVARASAAGSRAGGEKPDIELSPIEPLGWGSRLIALVSYGLNWAIMRSIFRLRTVGREELPPPGSYIIVANHVSYLDAPALAAALPYRQMRKAFWGGDAALLFSIPLSGWLWRALHVFPVDERKPGEALARIFAMLAAENALFWFPEGWRSPTGELQRFLPGIGKIVSESGRAVVPVHISGTFEALPRGRVFPRPHRITVTFGAPIRFDPVPVDLRTEATFSRIADSLRETVRRLGEASAGAKAAISG